MKHHVMNLFLKFVMDFRLFHLLILIKDQFLLCVIETHILDNRVSKGMVNILTEAVSFPHMLLELIISKVFFGCAIGAIGEEVGGAVRALNVHIAITAVLEPLPLVLG